MFYIESCAMKCPNGSIQYYADEYSFNSVPTLLSVLKGTRFLFQQIRQRNMSTNLAEAVGKLLYAKIVPSIIIRYFALI